MTRASSVTTTTTTTRLYAEQVPEWQRFQSSLNDAPQRQYSHVYHQRLAQIGPLIRTRLAARYPNLPLVPRLLELPEDQFCAGIGTVVVEGDLSLTTTASVLEETDADALLEVTSLPRKQNMASYYLEDESGRVALDLTPYWNNASKEDAIDFCTGLVVGVMGTVDGADGVWHVERVVSAATVRPIVAPPPLTTTHHPTSESTATAPHLLLLSGLECGSPHASSLPRDMLLSYLQGLLPHANSKAHAVCHVIVAGALVYHSSADDATIDGCRDLDAFLYQLTQGAGVPVSILPGANDPTTAQWPQRPLHASLLPLSSSQGGKRLSRCPNPYAATFVGADGTRRRICGTDGANVRTAEHTLDALQATLQQAHLCPTGPRHVPTVPHAERDPMVLSPASESWPEVYFSGNAPALATRLVQCDFDDDTTHDTAPHVCRLVCLPKFIDTGRAVLVNLQSLDVEVLKFAL